MEMLAGNSVLAVDSPGRQINVGTSLLSFPEGCQAVLNEFLETPPMELGRKDLALLNLLCAPALPGSENLDIPKCIARLDKLTAFVKETTERNLHRFPSHPEYGHSEPMWRVGMLITLGCPTK